MFFWFIDVSGVSGAIPYGPGRTRSTGYRIRPHRTERPLVHATTNEKKNPARPKKSLKNAFEDVAEDALVPYHTHGRTQRVGRGGRGPPRNLRIVLTTHHLSSPIWHTVKVRPIYWALALKEIKNQSWRFRSRVAYNGTEVLCHWAVVQIVKPFVYRPSSLQWGLVRSLLVAP
jgi:hypothetical protein